jgi:hypothetical protein
MQRVHFVDPGWETTWGLGFQTWRRDGTTFTGHGGTCPGYRTQLLLEPEAKIALITMTNAYDVDAGGLARQAFRLVSPAIKAARKDSTGSIRAADVSIDRYLGAYETFSGNLLVIRWEGELATMAVPTADPVAAITKYRKTGEHVFRRIRDDGELGESLTFDLGPDGRPTRARTNYLMPRAR